MMTQRQGIFQKSVNITKWLLFSIIFHYILYGRAVCITILFVFHVLKDTNKLKMLQI